MREFIPPATRFVYLPSAFPMKRGGTLQHARIAYETWGRPNAARDNIILILGGLSVSAHAASHAADPSSGWWEAMLGPGRPIDTNYWYVICLNSLGSCKGSTGPASLNPETDSHYGLSFPDLSIEDIADAAASAVRALGANHLACVIGASMGGMVALALLAKQADLVRTHINISSAVNASPFAIAFRSLQREIIRRDPLWNEGCYNGTHYPEEGMVTARKLGIITYRSACEWTDRFGRRRRETNHHVEPDPFGPEFEVESYLEGQSRRFARSYDPNCYLYLSRSMDRYDLGEAFDSNAHAVLSGMQLESALTIGVRTDILFPLEQQRQIADGLTSGAGESQFVALGSPQGHDAFLVDFASFGPPIAEFLRALRERQAQSVLIGSSLPSIPGAHRAGYGTVDLSAPGSGHQVSETLADARHQSAPSVQKRATL